MNCKYCQSENVIKYGKYLMPWLENGKETTWDINQQHAVENTGKGNGVGGENTSASSAVTSMTTSPWQRYLKRVGYAQYAGTGKRRVDHV